MSTLKERNLHFETKQLHVGQEQADPVTDARAVPIYATTSYVFHNSQHAADRFGLRDAGNIYGRLTNPTQAVFEERIAALEGGSAALAVASGAAAITYTIQALAKAGQNIVAAKTIYGGSFNLLEHTLPNYGITTTFVDPDEEDAFEKAIDENTRAIFIESLGNPNSNIIDIKKVAAVAHAHNIPLVIDSTFATPYLLRPFEHGADIVVHSATKFIGGHGTAIGGVIVESGKFDWAASGKFPQFSEPNPSYHGAVFTQAAPGAAFVTYIRAILLLRRLRALIIRRSPTRRIKSSTTSTSRTAAARFSPSRSKAARKKPRNSSTIFRFSRFSQTWRTLNLLPFIPHLPLIPSSPATSFSSRASSRTRSDFQSEPSISTTYSLTSRKRSRR